MVRVACCWDDGVATDVRLTELLRKYEAKATFNLCPGFMKEKRDDSRWHKLMPGGGVIAGFHGFEAGYVGLHEIKDIYGDFCVASHGWNHLNAGKVPDEDFLKDALDARHYLEDVFQRSCPGFAWPCGYVTPETENLLRNAGFLYARTVNNTDSVGKNGSFLRLDSSCHYQDCRWGEKFEAAKKAGGIFYFWGHSYEMMDCDGLWRQLEDKLALLHDDPEAEWIDVCQIVQ